jgi:hypothetical protein
MTDVSTVSPLRPTSTASVDILASRESFEHMQRVAKVFCTSSLIPDHLKKNSGADALLALQIAKRMNEDPVSVMQNIYFVSGKAGWSASYMIARANRSGVFKGPIRWKSEGQGDDLVVTARGRLAEIEGEDVDVSVSMKMAKAEGWVKNPKYGTMAEHMLRWRSATMLIRLYCPEVMMGMPTEDELTDQRYASNLRDVTQEGAVTTASQVGAILGAPAASDAAPAPEAAVDAPAADGEILPPEKGAGDTPVNWRVNAVGQDAIIKGIKDLLGTAPRPVDVDAILKQNADRIEKYSEAKRAEINAAADDRRGELAKAAA